MYAPRGVIEVLHVVRATEAGSRLFAERYLSHPLIRHESYPPTNGLIGEFRYTDSTALRRQSYPLSRNAQVTPRLPLATKE